MTDAKVSAADIIKRLQEEANEERKKSSGDGLNKVYLNMDPGDAYTLRFLPPKGGLESGLPWKEFYTHWVHTAGGSENVVCAQSYENPINPCPYCVKANELKDKGDDKAHGMAKAKHKVVMYAVNRFEEVAEGELPSLYIFELPQWYFRDFRGLLIRDDGFVGMSPFSNENGYDVVVSREGEGTDTKYYFELRKVKTDEGIMSKKTPLFDDPELVKAFMEKVPDILKYKNIEFTEEEIEAMLSLKTSQRELLKAYFNANSNSDEKPEKATATRARR